MAHPDRRPRAARFPGLGAVAPRDTSPQHKTRSTVPCEVVYPWHPWFALAVWSHGEVAKNEALLRCSLQAESSVRTLEIPQWMFHRVSCCRMQLESQPVVGAANLRALQQLLRHVGHSPDLLEDQHRSSTREGDADAKGTSSPDSNLGSVSSTPTTADVVPVAGAGQAPRSGTTGSSDRGGTKTKSGTRTRQGGRP